MCFCFSEFQNLLNNNKFTRFSGFNDSNLSYNFLYLSYLAQADTDSFTPILITNFTSHILSLISYVTQYKSLYFFNLCGLQNEHKLKRPWQSTVSEVSQKGVCIGKLTNLASARRELLIELLKPEFQSEATESSCKVRGQTRV